MKLLARDANISSACEYRILYAMDTEMEIAVQCSIEFASTQHIPVTMNLIQELARMIVELLSILFFKTPTAGCEIGYPLRLYYHLFICEVYGNQEARVARGKIYPKYLRIRNI